MLIEFSVFGSLLLLSAFVSLYLFYYMKDKTEDKIFYYFSFLLFFCFVNFISQGLECTFTPFYIKNFFGHLCVLGYTMVPFAWLLYVYTFTHQNKTLDNKIKYSLLIVPIIVIISLISDPWTHWFFNNITLSTSAYKLQLAYSYNWAAFLGYIYNYILGLINIIIVVYAILKGNKLHRKGYFVLLIASLVILILSPLGLTNLYPNFSFEALGLVFAILFLAIAAIIYDSFDIMPMVNKKIIKDINVGICYFDKEDKLITANSACEIINITDDDLNKEASVVFKNPDFYDFYKNKNLETLEYYLNNKWYEIKKQSMINEGEYLGLIFTITDITSRKFELEQKDMLVKEVNHRVKNNLQIILSLLNLDLRFHPEDPLSVLEDTRSRLNYMSILHEKIYKSSDFAEVNVKDYLPDIAKSLLLMYNSEIKVETDIDDTVIDLDLAVSLGLILTEIINNTVKYAFSNNEEDACFYINFHKEASKGVLDLYDNGKGLPEGFDLDSSSGLGMTVIKSLTAQIEGETEIISDKGAHFRIIFPL